MAHQLPLIIDEAAKNVTKEAENKDGNIRIPRKRPSATGPKSGSNSSTPKQRRQPDSHFDDEVIRRYKEAVCALILCPLSSPYKSLTHVIV